jgi:hypothetical protein
MNIETLKAFCAKPDAGRQNLETPFRVGEHVYATSGWMIVRVPAADAPDVGERDDAPNLAHILSALEASTDDCTEEVPDVGPVPVHECEACDGNGKLYFCDECEGEGDVYWDTARHSYEATCNECYGTGKSDSSGTGEGETCDKCGGKGEIQEDREEDFIVVGGWALHPTNARLLRSVGGRIKRSPHGFRSALKPIRWAAVGCDGVVRPMEVDPQMMEQRAGATP